MSSERLTAFTDGVVAVIITIPVLELKPPHAADVASLATLGTTFLSFAFVVPLVSYVTFIAVAAVWLAPDRRVAALLAERDEETA